MYAAYTLVILDAVNLPNIYIPCVQRAVNVFTAYEKPTYAFIGSGSNECLRMSGICLTQMKYTLRRNKRSLNVFETRSDRTFICAFGVSGTCIECLHYF